MVFSISDLKGENIWSVKARGSIRLREITSLGKLKCAADTLYSDIKAFPWVGQDRKI